MKKWIVRLEAEERERLRQLVRVGKTAAYKIRHANVLLAVGEICKPIAAKARSRQSSGGVR